MIFDISDESSWASITAIIVNSVSLWNMNPFWPRTNEENPSSLFFSENWLAKSAIAETKLLSSLIFRLLLEYSLVNIGLPSFESRYIA